MDSIKITIDGIAVGLKFGLPAMRHFFEKMLEEKLTISKKGVEMYTDLGITHILWGGYLNAQIAKDLPRKIEFERFYDLVEEDIMNGKIRDEILQAIKSFEESKSMKMVAEGIEQGLEQEKKYEIDWDRVEGFCFGELGLKPSEYYNLKWREYVLMEAGYYRRRNLEFEHTRAISYFSVRPWMKHGIPMHEFWSLPQDQAWIDGEEKRLLEILAESKKLFDARKKN